MQGVSCCITDLFILPTRQAWDVPSLKGKQMPLRGGCGLWGLSALREVKDESGLQQAHIISGRSNSRGDVLSQASSDIVSCHFIFFTGLKSLLLMICLDSSGCPQSHRPKLQEECLVALGVSKPVPSASSQRAWEQWTIIFSPLW